MTRKLSFAMNVSLDGYVAAPGDDLGWSMPNDEVFRWWSDRVGSTELALCGRRLWEAMSSHWPTAGQQPGVTPVEGEYARRWLEMPKVVFSSTISAVDWNARRIHSAHLPGPGGWGHALLHALGQLGEPETAGHSVISQRCSSDPI